MAGTINPGTLGPGSSSATVNAQLVPAYRSANYYPRPLAPAGPGGISSGVTNPAFPPQMSGGVGGGGAAAAANTAGQQAAAAPLNPLASPVPWCIAALLIGFVMLRFVHHGY